MNRSCLYVSAIGAMVLAHQASAIDWFTTLTPVGGISNLVKTETDFGNQEVGIDLSFTFTGSQKEVHVVPANVAGQTGEREVRYLRITATAGTGGDKPVVVLYADAYPTRYIRRVGEITQTSSSEPVLVSCYNVGQFGASETSRATISAAQVSIIAARVNGSLTGHTGNIYADITATGGGTFGGDISERIRAEGNFFGSATAANTNYGFDVDGAIGSSTYPITASGRLLLWVKGASVYGNFSTSSGNSSDYLGRIESTSGPIVGSISTRYITPPGFGVFDSCYIKANTDLDANITVAQHVAAGNGTDAVISAGSNFVAGRLIKIGGSLFYTDASNVGGISVGSGGLDGQVLINANNASGAWQAPIKVGGTSISTDSFTRPASSTYGDGSVSRAPQCLYSNDCAPAAPAAGTSVALPATSTSPVPIDFQPGNPGVVIRFDGPITTSGSNPVVIECTPLSYETNLCSAPSWQDVSSGFAITTPGSGTTGTAARTITIKAASSLFVGPGIYRVAFPGVKSRDVTGTPAVVAPTYCSGDGAFDGYVFRVGVDCDEDGIDRDQPDSNGDGTCETGCPDFNGTDGITVQDIFDFLNIWFQSCDTHTYLADCDCVLDTMGSCGSVTHYHADFNGSGTLSVQDIFDFLNAWFAGPAACD